MKNESTPVIAEIERSGHPFSAFYQNNPVLIQFIIEEFIQTHQLIHHTEKLMSEKFDLYEPEHLFSLLMQTIVELIGHYFNEKRPSLAYWSKGTLSKLKDNCNQLSLNYLHNNKLFSNFHLTAHETWVIATHTYEILNSVNANHQYPLLPLKRSFLLLHLKFNRMKRILPKILFEFIQNENVLYFLLKKIEDLTTIYGYNLIQKGWKGIKKSESLELMLNRYKERGFDSHEPAIKHLFETLDIM